MHRIQSWIISLALLTWLIVVPLATIPKIGISWDEPFQRSYGQALWQAFQTGNSQSIRDHSERYYGPLIPLILSTPESVLDATARLDIEIYETRHILTWCTFIMGVFLFFQLAKLCMISTQTALLGTLVLATTPLIAGHALFNSKDIPFLVAILGLVWASIRFAASPTIRASMWLSIWVAISVLCRINAIHMIAVIWVACVVLYPTHWRSFKWIGITVLVSTGLIYLGWPLLWDRPITSLFEAWHQMANYPWTGTVLFDGSFISAQSLPARYIPTWMGITLSPLLIIGTLFVIPILGWHGYRSQWQLKKSAKPIWIVLAAGLAPLFGVWLSNPTLYDGWRHLFFIYPLLLLCVIYCWDQFSPIATQLGLVTLIGHSIWIWTVYFPFPHCYLNDFAGPRESMIYRWETDYWGTTYRQLIEPLPPTAVIIPDNDPARITALSLGRIVGETPTPNGVFITNHRWRPGPLALPVIQSVVRDSITLSTAYQLPHTIQND